MKLTYMKIIISLIYRIVSTVDIVDSERDVPNNLNTNIFRMDNQSDHLFLFLQVIDLDNTWKN